MSTPTPGPWIIQRDSGLRLRIQTASDKGTIAYTTARPFAWSSNFSHEQIEANARLIAAAPDMLEALWLLTSDSLHEHLCYDHASIECCGATSPPDCGFCIGRKAIAKAVTK